jgi:hypothetical protein
MSALVTQTTTTTKISTAAGVVAAERFLVEAERVRRLGAEQVVLTQSRCVDHLLDLLNLTSETAVRAVLEAGLRDIRRLSAVEGAALVRTVGLAVAASHVESSYEDLVLDP